MRASRGPNCAAPALRVDIAPVAEDALTQTVNRGMDRGRCRASRQLSQRHGLLLKLTEGRARGGTTNVDCRQLFFNLRQSLKKSTVLHGTRAGSRLDFTQQHQAVGQARHYACRVRQLHQFITRTFHDQQTAGKIAAIDRRNIARL